MGLNGAIVTLWVLNTLLPFLLLPSSHVGNAVESARMFNLLQFLRLGGRLT